MYYYYFEKETGKILASSPEDSDPNFIVLSWNNAEYIQLEQSYPKSEFGLWKIDVLTKQLVKINNLTD